MSRTLFFPLLMHPTKPEPPLLCSDKGQKHGWGVRREAPLVLPSSDNNLSPTLTLTGEAAYPAAREFPQIWLSRVVSACCHRTPPPWSSCPAHPPLQVMAKSIPQQKSCVAYLPEPALLQIQLSLGLSFLLCQRWLCRPMPEICFFQPAYTRN